VDAGQQLLRIDRFLFIKIEHVSRNKIQQAAAAGNILVNGNSVKQNYKVKPGDEISVLVAGDQPQIDLSPEDIPLDIIFEDESLMIINKKAGMVVHPAYGNYNGTLLNALAFHFGENPGTYDPDNRPYLVHRLDKDTSGLMVVCKNDRVQPLLARQFSDHSIRREYKALAWGDFDEENGTVQGHIGRNLKDRKVMDVFPDGRFGKHAVTHYEVTERFHYVTMLTCRLETGRTHQIRAHMKHIRHPLFNDAAYGGDQILWGTTFTKYKQFVKNCFALLPRQALHAATLGFVHPVSGKEMYFSSDLPEDFGRLVEKWRLYAVNQGAAGI
jgi:23S rRNA pseudouridine1911/1915/1917 synthase